MYCWQFMYSCTILVWDEIYHMIRFKKPWLQPFISITLYFRSAMAHQIFGSRMKRIMGATPKFSSFQSRWGAKSKTSQYIARCLSPTENIRVVNSQFLFLFQVQYPGWEFIRYPAGDYWSWLWKHVETFCSVFKASVEAWLQSVYLFIKWIEYSTSVGMGNEACLNPPATQQGVDGNCKNFNLASPEEDMSCGAHHARK